MTVSLKHSKVTTKPDGVDNSLIQPSDWNADHVLTQDSNRLLGRTTAGVGATEEISVGSGLTLGSGSLSANVTSVAGRTGAVTLGVTDVSGAAPLASPALTGTPTAPTAAVGTNTTQLATTAYVQAEGYLKSATAASTYAPLASPALTGSPTAPTAATADNSTLIATTAFVKAQSYLTTTSAASTYAPLASPALTGTPTAPTAAVNTNTGQVATTAFVLAQASNATPLMDGTAAVGTATRFSREDHVHPTDTTRAPLASPALTGTPTAPTAAVGTNTTQIATTAYVQAEGYLKATTASTTYAPLASPALTGTPTAPTAAANTNTTQIATTAFVVGQGYLTSSTAASTYAPINSPTFTGTVTIPAGASISGYLTTSAAAAGYVPQTAATGAATLPSGTSAQRPGSPAAGQVRYNTNTGKFEGYSTTWGNLGGGAAIGDNPPANPGAGDLWWNSADGNLYVYYTDANTSQWVSVTLGGQGEYLPASGGTLSGSLTFAGTARRIGGDTINATVSNRLLWQDTGTNQPSAFGVIPNGTATSSFVQLFNSSTPDNSSILTLVSGPTRVGFTSTGIGTGSALPMIFSTAGTDRMVIDTSGNVGIGTSSPLGRFTSERPAGSAGWVLAARSTGIANESGVYTDASNNMEFAARNGSGILTARFGSTGDSFINAGNVGIGTNSPTYKLDVSGTVRATSDVRAPTFSLFNTSGNYSGVQFFKGDASLPSRQGVVEVQYDNLMNVKTDANIPLIFATNNAERARFDTGGNFMVGRTNASFGSSGGIYLEGASGAIVGERDSNQILFLARYGGNSNGAVAGFYWGSGRSNVGNISVTSGSTSYNTSSDYRLKENVQPMQNGLATISALNPVTYTWKNDGSSGEGFVAHELADHIPLAVSGEKDAVDDDGKIVPQSVDYSKVVVHLVAAVQELKAELDAAKAEIAALKGAQ